MLSLSRSDLEIVRRAPMFSGLGEETVAALLEEARIVEYPRGKVVFLRGEPADRFYLVLSGWIKVFRDTVEGEQTVISIMTAGETFAEAAVFMSRGYPASAEVVNDARLIEVPAKPFIARLRADSALALKMLTAVSLRVRRLVRHIEQLQANSTPQRLGNFLLSLSDRVVGRSVVHLPYDKTLVAARLGMKPESLSRALAKLRAYGVRTQGSLVEITDLAGLRAYCQGGNGHVRH